MSAKKRLQKFIIFLSALSFLGSTGYSLAQMLRQGMQPLEETAPEENLLPLQQAQGYERVLEREPNNVVALQGLVKLRLQMEDFEGVVAPLEKLVKLEPQEEEYQAILASVQEMLEEGED
ncbi:MAG: tetratricopeptide repeat protein [Cyanophyceae cyanobacterium]